MNIKYVTISIFHMIWGTSSSHISSCIFPLPSKKHISQSNLHRNLLYSTHIYFYYHSLFWWSSPHRFRFWTDTSHPCFDILSMYSYTHHTDYKPWDSWLACSPGWDPHICYSRHTPRIVQTCQCIHKNHTPWDSSLASSRELRGSHNHQCLHIPGKIHGSPCILGYTHLCDPFPAVLAVLEWALYPPQSHVAHMWYCICHEKLQLDLGQTWQHQTF